MQKENITADEKFKKMIGDVNISDSIKINYFNNHEIDIFKHIYLDLDFEIVNAQNNMSKWVTLYGPKTIWEKALIEESMRLLNEMGGKIKSFIDVNNSYMIVRRRKQFDPLFINMIEKTNDWCWIKVFLKNHIVIKDEKDILKFNKSLYRAIILGRKLDKIEKERKLLLNYLGKHDDKKQQDKKI